MKLSLIYVFIFLNLMPSGLLFWTDFCSDGFFGCWHDSTVSLLNSKVAIDVKSDEYYNISILTWSRRQAFINEAQFYYDFTDKISCNDVILEWGASVVENPYVLIHISPSRNEIRMLKAMSIDSAYSEIMTIDNLFYNDDWQRYVVELSERASIDIMSVDLDSLRRLGELITYVTRIDTCMVQVKPLLLNSGEIDSLFNGFPKF